MASSKKQKIKLEKKHFIYLLSFLVFVIVSFLIVQYLNIRAFNKRKEQLNLSDYQAVFLSNNQTYFGKILKEDQWYLVLDDVHYLQAESKADENTSLTSPEIVVIPLGSELHGPLNQMKISRHQILFIEELKTDSKVVESILETK